MLDVRSTAPRATPDYTGRRGFDELMSDRRGLLERPDYEEQVGRIVVAMVRAFRQGHKVLWLGNGGSAADAQHLAAEFSGRFLRERPGLASEALTPNTAAVTAIANDFGYEFVFSRMVEALAREGDVVAGSRPVESRPTSSTDSKRRSVWARRRSHLPATVADVFPKSPICR